MIPEQRPRSWALPGLLSVVMVLVALAVSVVIGAVGESDATTFECTVTPAGEDVRRQTDVGVEHRPTAVAGDRYHSTSGCLSLDEQREVRSSYGD